MPIPKDGGLWWPKAQEEVIAQIEERLYEIKVAANSGDTAELRRLHGLLGQDINSLWLQRVLDGEDKP